MLNTLFTLYLSFLKIGFTAFGGVSMIPLVMDEMLSHGYMTESEVVDIVAIAEMTPGPVGVNCSTFAGVHVAGVIGAIVACLGVLTPSLTLAYIVGIFFEKFKKNRIVGNMMVGVRPATIGMIFGVIITLSLSNYALESGGVSYVSICMSLVDIFLLIKLKISIPIVILINAAAGALLFGVLGLT